MTFVFPKEDSNPKKTPIAISIPNASLILSSALEINLSYALDIVTANFSKVVEPKELGELIRTWYCGSS